MNKDEFSSVSYHNDHQSHDQQLKAKLLSYREMASNSKETYKYKFLSEPDDAHKCPICLDVAEEPWQHSKCGRLFCRSCLDSYGTDKPCIHCKMEQPLYFEDNKSKREIKNFRVSCDNIDRNCEWKGTVGELNEHLAKCDFTLLPCPNECIDDQMSIEYFVRKSLSTHKNSECPNRDYKCTNGRNGDMCGEKGTHYYITQVHDKVCLKKIIPCTSTGCPKTLARQHMDQHVKSECEHTVIACKYKSIGCETELKRKDMPAHELDDKLHHHMAINTVTMMNDREINREEPITIRFIDYKVRKERVDSPTFYTSQGYHMALRVYADGCGDGKGTHISVFAEIVKGKHDLYLGWPLIGSITFTLLNQLEDKNHYSQVVYLSSKQDLRAGQNWGRPLFIPHSALGHDPIKNTQYLKDDTLYFTVLLKVKDNKPWLQCETSSIM